MGGREDRRVRHRGRAFVHGPTALPLLRPRPPCHLATSRSKLATMTTKSVGLEAPRLVLGEEDECLRLIDDLGLG